MHPGQSWFPCPNYELITGMCAFLNTLERQIQGIQWRDHGGNVLFTHTYIIPKLSTLIPYMYVTGKWHCFKDEINSAENLLLSARGMARWDTLSSYQPYQEKCIKYKLSHETIFPQMFTQ